jgi:hypothetical protein
MEVRFTLWTLSDILKSIPFNKPSGGDVHLDFSNMKVPYYVQNWFKLSIFYVGDECPFDAMCCIFSPQDVVTVVIILKKKYEDDLRKWQQSNDESVLDQCYRRGELYCHETCHLVAIIRAYPSNRYKKEREDFEDKIRKKFDDSINADLDKVGSTLISRDMPGESPSEFEKDHFSYEGDGLNYFKLYAELMLPYIKLYNALKKIASTKGVGDSIHTSEVSRETLVPLSFFNQFPDKLAEANKILNEGFDS